MRIQPTAHQLPELGHQRQQRTPRQHRPQRTAANRQRQALQQYWAGQIELAPPQIMSLAHLARHPAVDSVLSAARGRRPPVIQPEPFDHEGQRVICYPGDTRHSVREQALPGPTRLSFRNKRFEPDAGFEALFL